MPRSRRQGIALFAALALMSVIALLVAGAAASTRLGQRTARLARIEVLLTTATDYALATVLANALHLALADLPFARPVTIDVAIPGATDVHVVVAVTRLPQGVLWMVADASAGGVDLGHRRVNLVARFLSIGPRPPAGVVSRGDVQLGAGVTVAADTSSDPECAASANSAIVVAPGAVVTSVDSTHVVSSPAALDSASYFLLARQLDALRDGGQLLHVPGDTTIAGGVFDGILIVDGSLTITGPFTVTGLIVTQGRIDASAGSFSLTGAVMAFAPKSFLVPAIKFSGVTIRYSPCAIDRALRRALVPRSVSQRSWAELF
jgi:hypothetical protein